MHAFATNVQRAIIAARHAVSGGWGLRIKLLPENDDRMYTRSGAHAYNLRLL